MARSEPEIIAAGVVLVRDTDAGREVCVLHRPRRRDWSMPKGKLEPGEHIVTAARRETIEETGCDVALGRPLPTQHYQTEGRAKTVYYWVGTVRLGGPGFSPNREIDKIEWLTPEATAARLTYPRDVDLMMLAVESEPTTPLVVLRHGQAIRRSRWKKSDDNGRPLAPVGVAQADGLVKVLGAFDLRRVAASDAVRCLDTIRPYARSISATVQHEPLLSESGFSESPTAALGRVDALLADHAPTVVCTHRPVLPELFEHLARRAGMSPTAPELNPSLPPGCFVVLHRSFDSAGRMRIVAVDRHAP